MSWIVVPNWDRFQHYKNRHPPWIKNYTKLLDKPEYLNLTLGERGLLHGIWLAYAETNGQLELGRLNRKLETSTRQKQLASLNHAGLIELRASKPLCSLDLKTCTSPRRSPAHVAFELEIEGETVDHEFIPLEQIKAYAATLAMQGHKS